MPTRSCTLHTTNRDSAQAGAELGAGIRERMAGEAADAVIVFASSQYDHATLLDALNDGCRPRLMVGSSSAGEFTHDAFEEGTACAIALRSDEMAFSAGLGRGLHADRIAAARDLVGALRGMNNHGYAHRSALVMTDALAGHADDFVEQLTLQTAGTYKLFGGGAGDDANFRKTHVFFGTEAIPDAAVCLEILSNKPLGVGVCHGWEPATPPMRVTSADGMILRSLNGHPAGDVFVRHAEATGQQFDVANPIPFFLHNVLGIATDEGFRLRVPLSVAADGVVTCAADIPEGATIHIMKPQTLSAVEATKRALAQLDGAKPEVALFFDCVATRLRMGREFGFELKAVEQALGKAPYAGCNTYGQIARAEGQFNGFHNCTAVVCVIPA
ncbi:MAG TPA: FIST N-terminal domain-containing protein [Planctomycetota bacterium]|nr:FIST N-terminal domain-containing protein [Planctomycetota bacterium]